MTPPFYQDALSLRDVDMIGGISKMGLAACLVVALMVSTFATPARACDRSEGDYWTYEISTSLDETELTGSITYAYVDDDTIETATGSREVSVMSVTGSVEGTGDVNGIEVNITGTYSGMIYEDKSALATVMEDMHMWANLSRDTGQYIQTDVWTFHDVTSYSPPLGMEFVPGDVETGDSWTEVVDRATNSSVEVNGVLEHESDEIEKNITFSYSIASSVRTVNTEAGTFECLLVNLTTDDSDDFELYWYSEEVGYFVKISMYSEGDDSPYTTLELTSFQKAEEDDSMDILVIGIGVLVAIVIIVAVALAMRKRGKKPTMAPPAPPPAQ